MLNANDTALEDAAAVLDAFHVTKLGVDVVDEVRRRVQQATTGHGGRKDDPLYKVRNVLRAGARRSIRHRRRPSSARRTLYMITGLRAVGTVEVG